MTNVGLPALAAILMQVGLGLIVFQANPKRRSNQCFLLLSFSIGGWLTCLYFGLSTDSPTIAEICVRSASSAGVVIFTLFNLLRLSIREKQRGWRGMLGHSRL